MISVLILALAGCSLLPEELQNRINGILGTEDQGGDNQLGEHIHNFVVTHYWKVSCTEDGYENRECSCGETEEQTFTALGHDMKRISEVSPTCVQYGYINYKCSRCGKIDSERLSPLGHEWGKAAEPSRLAECVREGCESAGLADGNGKYDETLNFSFTEEQEKAFTEKYDEVLSIVYGSEKYDPARHAYSETGELAEYYDVIDALYTELYDMVLYAGAQRQIAELDYYCDMDNADLEERYSYMSEYYTDLVATFYSLAGPFYDSCYREFFYYGMTEAEIKAYLFDCSAVSNPEYIDLNARNDEIRLEFLGILNPSRGSKVTELYAEFVANNNRIAEIMGYENYLDYAYESLYGREYSYKDVAVISDYTKENLSSAYSAIYRRYINIMNSGNYTFEDVEEYYSQIYYSFFEDIRGNATLNDYIDIMAFTSNPDKQISFSDEFNGLMSEGNLFRGDYEGAFVTYLFSLELPVAYFSEGYDTPFTVAHEFGHYMNEAYNNSNYNQSFDLLEMHSQGNELLYLFFLENQLDEEVFRLVEIEHLLGMMDTVIASLAVDSFEQAVYLNSYDGTYAEYIMEDGKITADEYDLLYSGILYDFGVSEYHSSEYWRYVTITAPCYYVSYAISAISVLQLYETAGSESFDAAKEAYLKLFTYTDTLESTEEYMTAEEVLVYAGMLSYNDEELYKLIFEFLSNL